MRPNRHSSGGGIGRRRSGVWHFGATSREEGASAVEYALLIALIAAVIFGAIVLLGGTTSDLFSSVPDF